MISHNLPAVTQRVYRIVSAYSPSDPRLLRLMYKVGAILEQEAWFAYRNSGLKVQTGTLINSLKARYRRNANGASVFFSPWGVKYATIHEFGGKIRAKAGGLLRFKVNGKWVSKKEVRIPARPYFRPTFVRARMRIIKMLEEGGTNG
jgi:phage gpG-like protein